MGSAWRDSARAPAKGGSRRERGLPSEPWVPHGATPPERQRREGRGMSDDHDATGEGRKADPELSDSTGADESGVIQPGSTPYDNATPGGDAGVTADMVEAAEAEALAEVDDVEGDADA